MPQGTRERPFVLPGSLASQALDRVDYLDVFSAPVPKRATLDEVAARVLGDGEATLATLVRFHNGWGRAYFACVRPFHGLIVKGMLRRAGAHPVSESN